MNEFVIFAICTLAVFIASLISIWTTDETSDLAMTDYWWWQLPM